MLARRAGKVRISRSSMMQGMMRLLRYRRAMSCNSTEMFLKWSEFEQIYHLPFLGKKKGTSQHDLQQQLRTRVTLPRPLRHRMGMPCPTSHYMCFE
ncbi:hypothetical protein IF1G_03882 [Cordyceps javanica]|uniref:Uncharacterized protein n=1 Tax=Cordyceps javanica TaxID=43265 RepID=A0A545V946_9HYPO|nr:hypothetical protein IF1G_03882 [Cordyceps javanica]